MTSSVNGLHGEMIPAQNPNASASTHQGRVYWLTHGARTAIKLLGFSCSRQVYLEMTTKRKNSIWLLTPLFGLIGKTMSGNELRHDSPTNLCDVAPANSSAATGYHDSFEDQAREELGPASIRTVKYRELTRTQSVCRHIPQAWCVVICSACC